MGFALVSLINALGVIEWNNRVYERFVAGPDATWEQKMMYLIPPHFWVPGDK
ncbi:MAG: hypothetical protein Ct9H300mP29_5520 [Candidatus Neomarinimicrobiota bacterium]|nr:MAG: hypothetical protein Ct9H300mP29_5520 [Candidatus Neomarinimicrobiota bacterium]